MLTARSMRSLGVFGALFCCSSCEAPDVARELGEEQARLMVDESKADPFRAWFDAADARNPSGYTASSDSGTLAWAEAPILEAYLVMFQSYRDVAYVDKLVAHLDAVVAHRSDPDRDGHFGWQTPRYSREKVTNGTFRSVDGSDPSLPAGWRRWRATAATAARSTMSGEWVANDDAADTAGLRVSTSTAGWQVVEQRIGDYRPGWLYEVSFLSRASGVGARVEVVDVTSSVVLGRMVVSNQTWTSAHFRFRAPAVAGHELALRLYHDRWNAVGTAWFDTVSMRLCAEFAVHEGLILLPAAELLLEARRSPSLAAHLGPRLEHYRSVIDDTLAKWDGTWKDLPSMAPAHTPRGVYVYSHSDEFTALLPAGASLPHNQYLMMARLHLAFAEATGSPVHRARAAALAETFRSALSGANGSLVWNYADRLVPADDARMTKREDTHATLDVAAAADFVRAGVWPANDLRRFSDTFLTTMWNGDHDAPTFGRNVGTRSPVSDDPLAIHGWVSVAKTDPRLFELARRVFVDPPASGKVRLAFAQLADANPARGLNRDFEWPGEPFALWTLRGSPAAVWRSIAPEDVHSGAAAAVITTDGSSWNLLESELTGPPGVTTSVSFWAKTNGLVQARVEVFDGPASLGNALVSTSDWSQASFTFRMPTTGRTVLRCSTDRADVAGGRVVIDEVRVTR